MKKFFFFLVLLLVISPACKKGTESPGGFTDKEMVSKLQGSWKTIKGDLEEVCFEKDRNDFTYMSYLNGRPARGGTWSINNGKLKLVLSDRDELVIYEKVIFTDSIVILIKKDGEEEKYSKIIE